MTRKRLLFILLGFLAMPCAGCGGGSSKDAIESRQSAQKAYDDALQAIASKDYTTAKPLLDQAIDSGWLYVDMISSAYVNRAICSAAAGDFAAAHADLDEMEKGAPNLDEIFAARSYVLEKQGKTKAAKAAWSRARRMNRYVKKYTD